MSKQELEERLEKASDDIGDMIEKLTEQQLRIAYLEGIIDGADVKPKRRGSMIEGPNPTEEEMMGMLDQDLHSEEEECNCKICLDDDREMVKKFG